jgi:hypothetical protein
MWMDDRGIAIGADKAILSKGAEQRHARLSTYAAVSVSASGEV